MFASGWRLFIGRTDRTDLAGTGLLCVDREGIVRQGTYLSLCDTGSLCRCRFEVDRACSTRARIDRTYRLAWCRLDNGRTVSGGRGGDCSSSGGWPAYRRMEAVGLYAVAHARPMPIVCVGQVTSRTAQAEVVSKRVSLTVAKATWPSWQLSWSHGGNKGVSSNGSLTCLK
jgi:hypothetical protein